MEHFENESRFKGLKVNDGVEQPPSVHPESVRKFLANRKNPLSVDDLFNGIREGNITLLSKAVTLVESSKPEHIELAREIVMKCLPLSGKSVRIGITGIPGVGKSTFIEALGRLITESGSKLGVLAIDPTSERSGGSILGDKTRMEALSSNPRAYIRPSPSAGTLGGVARKTRETIILCEAAGFDTLFIETVGVGQSETAVHSMTDFFLLLMLPGAGDELQGIKRGIMEMADLLVVNKADSNNVEKAELAVSQYRNALHLFPRKNSEWDTAVLSCSATMRTGLSGVWNAIQEYFRLTKDTGYFWKNRNDQSIYWMRQSIEEQLKIKFYHDPEVKKKLTEFEQKVINSELSSFVAANELINSFFNKK